MKRDKFDILFSNTVRLRDNWTCTRCGQNYEQNHHGLHCSHIFGRRHRATRWEPLNAVAHCVACHNYLGENPVIFADWARKHLGNYVMDMLIEKHNQIIKITKADKKAMYAFMKEQYKQLEEFREYSTEECSLAGYL